MEIISRAAWGARAPRSVQTTARSNRRRFLVHYSAASPSQTVRTIQDYHMDHNGWSDIGYNFLVDVGGHIYMGRGWDVIGAHAQNHNTESIGVCFIGRNGDSTNAAKEAIKWLYLTSASIFGRTLTPGGHRDVNPTTCPGDELYAWVHQGMMTGADMDLSAKNQIVSGLTNGEVLRDLWIWCATTRGLVGDAVPRSDDRFQDPVSHHKILGAVGTLANAVGQLANDVSELKGLVAALQVGGIDLDALRRAAYEGGLQAQNAAAKAVDDAIPDPTTD
jgi:hypothetical protein